MSSLAKNIVKNGLLMFTVGFAVAYAAPILATLIGPALMGAGMAHATTSAAGAMWTAAVFGSFGAIHTALTPVFNRIFSNDKPARPASPAPRETADCCLAPSVDVTVANTQLNANVDINAQAKLHALAIDNRRNESPPLSRS